jgi:acylphosphatase
MTYRVKIYGNVQGVGFRYFIKNSADALGLKGWVKNSDDGSVELIAQTESETMDQFASVIEKGNGFSRVECIDIIELAEASYYKRFEILNS